MSIVRHPRRRPRPRLEALEARHLLSVAGAPDPTFGVGGTATVPVVAPSQTAGAASATEVATAVGPGGQVDLVGVLTKGSQKYLTVTQLNAGGRVDTSFGSGGQATVPIGDFTVSGAFVTGGGVLVALRGQSSTSFGAFRFTATGALDPTYGNGGLALYPVLKPDGTPSTSLDSSYDPNPGLGSPVAAIQPDGKLVVAGTVNFPLPGSRPGDSNIVPFVARLDAGGRLDPTFGKGGLGSVRGVDAFDSLANNPADRVLGLAIGPDGKIALLGDVFETLIPNGHSPIDLPVFGKPFVVQLDASGVEGTSFGGVAAGGTGGGVAVLPFTVGASSLAIQPDGKIVLVGNDLPATGIQVSRLNADGTPDTTLGSGGVVPQTLPPIDSGRPLIQGDGKVVIVGQFLLPLGASSTHPETVVLRLNADLTPDDTYGNNARPGLAIPANAPPTSTAAIEPNGDVILGGNAPAGSQPANAFVATRVLATATPDLADRYKVAGALDPGFGGGQGYITAPTGGAAPTDANSPALVSVQPDGKILVAERVSLPAMTTTTTTTTEVMLSRFNADGTTDAAFGAGGRVSLAMADNVVAFAVQTDGKILVAGTTAVPAPGPGGSSEVPMVFRLDSAGKLDPAFGASGAALLNPNFISAPSALAVQPDGKIVLAGTTPAQEASGGSTGFGVVRLDAAGKLDTSFGGSGGADVFFPISNAKGFPGQAAAQATPFGLAIGPDGKIVLAGQATVAYVGGASPGTVGRLVETALARFGAFGTLDTGFGGNSTFGRVILDNNPPGVSRAPDSAGGGLAIQPDGKIVVGEAIFVNPLTPGGVGQTALAAYRLAADGTPDATFGTGGLAVLAASTGGMNQFSESAPALALQADGGILLASNRGGAVVGRLTPAGVPDPGFGGTATPGIASTPILPGNGQVIPGLAVQPDGKILVAGIESPIASGTAALPSVVVARLLPARAISPALKQAPANLDGGGKTDLAVYLPAIGAFAYRPSSGGPDVFVPFGIPGAGRTIPALGDYTGAGHAEIAAYLPAIGVYAIRPAGGGPDIVVPFGIAGVGGSIPAPGDYEGSGRDDIAVYMPSIAAFGIRPSGGGPDRIIPFGIAGVGGSIPAPADYFGTGRSDIAVYLPSIGAFAIRPPGGGADLIVPFGLAGAGRSIPIPGDYDGSGKAELAVYLPTLGLFAYRPAGGGPDVIVPFGRANDGTVPVSGDYTGVGHDEIAVFDPNYALFAYRPPSGPDVLTAFGAAGPGRSLPVVGPPGTGSVAVPGVVRSLSVATADGRAVPSGPMVPARRAGRPAVAQAATPLLGKPA